MASAKAYESKMTRDEYEQMAREINRASESLYDEGSELASPCIAIELEKLWPILEKHLKPTSDADQGTTTKDKT